MSRIHDFLKNTCRSLYTQIYGFSVSSAALELQNRVSVRVEEANLWMRSNRLQLNPAKTEFHWFSRRQFQIPQVPFRAGTSPRLQSFVILVSASTLVSVLPLIFSRLCRNAFLLWGKFVVSADLYLARFYSRSSQRLFRLWQRNAGGAACPPTLSDTIRPPRRCSDGIWCSEVRQRDATVPWPSLASSPGADHVQIGVSRLPMSQWHRTSVPCRQHQSVADVDTRRRLRSSLSSAVTVPATRWSTIGKRAFPVAAARAWNSLPSFVISSSSLPSFKRQKAYLLELSYWWRPPPYCTCDFSLFCYVSLQFLWLNVT